MMSRHTVEVPLYMYYPPYSSCQREHIYAGGYFILDQTKSYILLMSSLTAEMQNKFRHS